jgi:hypothetical protein
MTGTHHVTGDMRQPRHTEANGWFISTKIPTLVDYLGDTFRGTIQRHIYFRPKTARSSIFVFTVALYPTVISCIEDVGWPSVEKKMVFYLASVTYSSRSERIFQVKRISTLDTIDQLLICRETLLNCVRNTIREKESNRAGLACTLLQCTEGPISNHAQNR